MNIAAYGLNHTWSKNPDTFVPTIKGSIPHFEELPLFYGIKGLDIAMDIHTSILWQSARITTKMDGSPAVFCGTDPRDGRFFVAKKSVLNKTPIVYKDEAEIVGLNDKLSRIMRLGLLHFPRVQHMIQGDLLFIENDHFMIKGVTGVQPNTIFYQLNKENFKIGVAWHTRYEPSIPGGIEGFRPIVNDLPHIPSTENMYSHMIEVNHTIIDVNRPDDAFQDFMNVWNIRQMADKIGQFDRALLLNMKMLMTRNCHRDELDVEIFNDLDRTFGKNNELAHDMYYTLCAMRSYTKALLKEINTNTRNFVRFKDGTVKSTGHEGFVVSGKLGIPVKMVDRSEFSYLNKSDDIIRGWSKE